MSGHRRRLGVFLCLAALLAPAPLTARAEEDSLGCAALALLGTKLPGFCNGNGNGAGNNGGGDGSNGNNPDTTTTVPGVTTTTTVPDPTTTTVPDPTTTTTTVESSTTTVPDSITTTTMPDRTTTTTAISVPTTPPSRTTVPPAAVTTAPVPPALPGGLGGVDLSVIPAAMAGAAVMASADGHASGPGSLAPPDHRMGGLLGPVVPPALADAVASPLVIFDVLVDALMSSGQALIIPALVLLVGLGLPAPRRRTLLGSLLDPDLALTDEPLRGSIA